MFHLTVAIARFFQFLLVGIVKSIVGLVGIGLIGLLCGIGGVVALRKLRNKMKK